MIVTGQSGIGPRGAALPGFVPEHLLRRHRQSEVPVFVSGGDRHRREFVAETFHRSSALGGGPFVALDGRLDGELLHRALQRWVAEVAEPAAPDPLLASAHGTLFVDHVADLSRPAQRMLLALAESAVGGSPRRAPSWRGRLMAGTALEPYSEVERGRLVRELLDCLDKIRVDLGGRRSRALPRVASRARPSSPARRVRRDGIVSPARSPRAVAKAPA